jgi:hypothetical protein
VEAYLMAVDAAAPGLVEGLYLTGSVALGDFRPHQSDIDFVAVVGARLDAARRTTLGRVHDALRRGGRRPAFEGVYVTWEDLATDPLLVAPAPSFHDGRFSDAGRFELNPVTWHVLARHGVAGRGPVPADVVVAADPAGLARWSRGNLDGYWRRWRARRARLWSPAGWAALGEWAPAWGVLGVSRIHFTLATGQITSKAGAGAYALEAFPRRWHRLLEECLRVRRGEGGPSLYRSRLSRRQEALAFVAMVVDDAVSPRPFPVQAGHTPAALRRGFADHRNEQGHTGQDHTGQENRQ